MTLHQLDAFEDAHEVLREGQRADEQLGNVSDLPVYDYELASLSYSAGRWEEAIGHAHAGLELADEVGLEMLLSWPLGVLALISVHRDELHAAAASLAALESRGDAETAAALARALLAEARADTDGALATLKRAWEHDAALGIVYRRRVIGPDLVRLSLAAGDRELASRVATGVEEATAFASVRASTASLSDVAGWSRATSSCCCGRSEVRTGTARVRTCGRLRGRRRRPCASRAEFRCRVLIRGRAARVLRGECKAGRRSSARHDAPRRPRPQAPRGKEEARARLGVAYAVRARGCAPRRERTDEPADRPAPLHLAAHGADPPGACLPQARPLLSSRACRRSGQARRSVNVRPTHPPFGPR